jgi:DNA polymerase-3 subunit epsilon
MKLFKRREPGVASAVTPSAATSWEVVLAPMLGVTPFAVVDVETTGFSPRLHDRVIEVAVVRLTPDGTIEDEYATLLNPGRDVGPTHVHGISAADVRHAPAFAEVVGDVAVRLAGAVVVGHNVRFDLGFLTAEFGRVGVSMPPLPAVCTLRLAYLLEPAMASRRLRDCCRHAGVAADGAHSALGDAHTTARLLAAYLTAALTRGLDGFAALGCQPLTWPEACWCTVSPSGRSTRREQALQARREQTTYLARLVEQLDSVGVAEPEVAAYLDVLDRALEDRRISEGEAEALLATAQEWGLSGDQITAAHHRYLQALVAAARADGVVTPAERRDLDGVCALLGLAPTVLDPLLADPTPPVGENQDAAAPARMGDDLAGRTVCFTGALSSRLDGELISRARAEELAAAAGLVVLPRVTKSLDVLVVADPDTLSSKTRKAREYGTRIMAEAVFWRAIGVAVA